MRIGQLADASSRLQFVNSSEMMREGPIFHAQFAEQFGSITGGIVMAVSAARSKSIVRWALLLRRPPAQTALQQVHACVHSGWECKQQACKCSSRTDQQVSSDMLCALQHFGNCFRLTCCLDRQPL